MRKLPFILMGSSDPYQIDDSWVAISIDVFADNKTLYTTVWAENMII